MFASCTGWAWPSSSLKIGKRIDPENVSWMDAYRWMKTKPSLILLQWSAGEQCAAYFETGEKDPTIFGKVSWLVENDLSSCSNGQQGSNVPPISKLVKRIPQYSVKFHGW
jgi:hypothetical protein